MNTKSTRLISCFYKHDRYRFHDRIIPSDKVYDYLIMFNKVHKGN